MPDLSQLPRNPAALLEEFVSGEDKEGAFDRIVEQYGGLVYSSALRRVGDPQLAEEIAQDVFALMAQRASTLRHHPAPVGWIFTTTKLKASHAMRTERRRKKKHDALATELAVLPAIGETEEDWSEIKPVLDDSLDALSEKDRQILLLRFFERLKFKEIAKRSGRSEGACKMHLQRAVERLASVLTGRGVALPTATLIAGITGLLTQAAPAKTIAILAPNALAAASGSIAYTGFFHTVTHLKASCIIGVAVLAATTGPAVWQHSKTQKLEKALVDLGAERGSLVEELAAVNAGSGGVGSQSRRDANPVSSMVKTMLSKAHRDVDTGELLSDLAAAVASDNLIDIATVLMPISDLDTEEFGALIDEIGAIEGQAQAKAIALELITPLAPTDDPEVTLDRMVALGLSGSSLHKLIAAWGGTDPDAALAWFDSKTATGKLAGKGAWDWENGEAEILGTLLGVIVKSDRQKALDILDGETADIRSMLATQMAWSLGQSMAKGVDDTTMIELISRSDAPADVVSNALFGSVSVEDFDAGLAFAKRFLPDPEDQLAVMDEMLGYSKLPFEERVAWMQANSPVELRGAMAERWASKSRP